jgi:hypothetical protein
VLVLTGDHNDTGGGDARNHPGQDAVADLLEHQPNRGPVTDGSRLCLRDREHDPNNGTQIPSLRPLSTFRPCLTRLASLISVTTA